MSFYGNVTNIFQFDEIYPNRAAMDAAAASGTDNIFQNRFVLIKYNQGTNDNDIAFTSNDIGSGYYYNGYMYVDAELQEPYYFTSFTRVSSPTISNWNQYYYSSDQNFYYKLPNETYFNANEHNYYIKSSTKEHTVYKNQIFRKKDENGNDTFSLYICKSGTTNYPAAFEELASQSIDSKIDEYLVNYNIDAAHYGANFDVKGYDATVWQKEFVGNTNGRFRLIASLNGTTPQLELSADQPVLEPKAPYIDSSSSKNVYKIKVPTKWGIQIKEETNENLSDQQVIQTKFSYDENSGTYISTQQQVDGAIYFNKDGATPIKKQRDNNTQNEIKLEYTGKSGKLYNGEEAEDTIDVSLHFPAIGNMISDGYDLIYGVNDDENQTRPRDINWYNGNEEILKLTGNASLGGKTYNLNTLAGTLNTMHQRLGQIIIPLTTRPNSNMISQYSTNYIYYIEDENKYFRIGPSYHYTSLTNSDYDFIPVSYNDINYITDTYYYFENGQFKISQGIEDTNNPPTLYKKSIKKDMYQVATDLIPYYPETYFLKRGQDYIRDNESQPSALGQQYYSINNSTSYLGSWFDGEYEANRFRYLDDDNNFLLDTNDIPTQGRDYYAINLEAQQYTDTVLYTKNRFYYLDNATGRYRPCGYDTIAEVRSNLGNNAQLYWLEFDEEQEIITSYTNDQGLTETLIGHPLKEAHPIYVATMRNVPSNISNFYYVRETDNAYIAYNNLNYDIKTPDGTPGYAIPGTYVFISDATLRSKLYVTGKYYRIDSTGSYIISYEHLNAVQTYYLINTVTPLEGSFYVPGVYFYESSEDYFEIDMSERMVTTPPPGRTYYIKERLFVIEDYTGRCPYGYEWSNYSIFVPASITLAKRNEYLQFIEITNFLDGEGSINGHLLQLEKYLEINNNDIRDKNTFKGALNILQDYLYVLDRLVPNRVLFVNDFGQITSSNITYSQLKDIISKYDQIMNL